MGNKTKPLVFAVVALGTITGLGALGAMHASAQTEGSSSIVEKIASTFNLQKDEVQAVFDEARDERQEEMHNRMSERLQAKVDRGDITSEQKSAIEAKFEELQDTREATMNSLRTWAEENSIDMKYVRGHNHSEESTFLDKAVTRGDLTAEQKSAIEAKRSELEKLHEAEKDALSAWAKELGVNLPELLPIHGKHGHRFGR